MADGKGGLIVWGILILGVLVVIGNTHLYTLRILLIGVMLKNIF